MVGIKTFIWLHLIISTTLISYFYSKNKNEVATIASSLIILFFPIGGAIIVYLLYLISTEFSSNKDYLDGFNYEKEELRFVKVLDVGEETRVIPMEKALIEEDILVRRQAVLNLIKKDVNNYTSLMNMALKNDDSETSHYAASSILHSKRKLDKNMNKLSDLYDNNKDNSSIMIEYANQLVEFINNEYIDKSTKTKYIQESISILERIVNEKLDSENKHIYDLINILLRTENFEKAANYTEILIKNYPKSEKQYLQALKAYYVINDYNKFDIVLKEFLSSDISFSKEAVNVVRFWLGG